ncbi:MAG: endolytic transglycosylase MltG [bacterium]|nr:endolytic transglycosylase MltG [bacterium]
MKKYFIFILLIALIVLAGFWLTFSPFSDNATEEVQFSVKKGEGSKDIALNLEKQDLIKWAPIFRLYVLAEGIISDLKAGEYLLSPDMNIPQIADKLARGDVIKISVTIPEGFTVKQIEDKLGFELSGDNLEGFLFPDTYQFSFGFSAEEVIEKMRDNFERKLDGELRDEITRQNKTVLQIVTMASLIEKEVVNLQDKKLVSGILWKRLETGMPLQVDATLVYLSEQEKWTFDETLKGLASFKEIDSAYNTYKYLGLPPGPICNPGLESIIAAVYPAESSYWYYLSTPEGETIFNETLQGHNSARAEYFR